MKYFNGHGNLPQSEESEYMWTHDKDGFTREFLKGATRGLQEELSSDAIFVVCSHTFTLFWLRNTAVNVKIFWLSFHVFTCAFPTVVSAIFGKSFPFPFLYFVLFILRYFPFHVFYIRENMKSYLLPRFMQETNFIS